MTTRVTQDGAVGLGSSFTQGGYETAYIGKWHAHGSPEGRLERRAAFVPAEASLSRAAAAVTRPSKISRAWSSCFDSASKSE